VLFGEGVGVGGWGGEIKSFLFTFLFALVYVPKNCPNRYKHVLRHTSPFSRRCGVVFFSVSPTTPSTSVYTDWQHLKRGCVVFSGFLIKRVVCPHTFHNVTPSSLSSRQGVAQRRRPPGDVRAELSPLPSGVVTVKPRDVLF